MATSDEHYEAYVSLRNAVLTRHFAMRRYWRSDLLSLQSQLVDPDTACTGTRANSRSLAGTRSSRTAGRTHSCSGPS